MKKHLLLTAALLSVFTLSVRADKDFVLLEEGTTPISISPGGQYVVGVNKNSFIGNISMESYVYDLSEGTTNWLTSKDETDLTKGGEFSGVADNGTICGTSKDTGHLFEGTAINAAAVWTKDGRRTLLGYGDFDMTKIKNSNDGARATAISADGKTVAGEFRTSNGAYLTPCVWRQDDGGAWQMSWLPMPEGAKGGQTTAVSADGSVVAGYVRLADSSKFPALWKDGECFVITDEMLGLTDGSSSIDLSGMSPNGKFVTATPQGGTAYLYAVETGEVRAFPIMDYIFSSFGDMLSGLSNFAVDNDGNVVYSIGYGGYWRPLWYYYAEDRTLDLSYYLDIFAYGVTPDISLSVDDMSPAKTLAVSADGSVIVGAVDNAFAPQCWILRSEKGTVKIPATPSGLKATTTGLNQVTLTWDKDETQYEGFTLKSYNVYCNAVKVAEVSATEPEMKAVIDNVPAGKPGFDIEAVFERADGSTLLSPRSNSIQVTMASTWTLPLYEDFSTGGIENNAWEVTYDESTMDYFSYTIDESYGMGFTLGLAMRIRQPGKPYWFAMNTRPIDATAAETVHMSFYVAYGLINIEDQDLSEDFLSLEISTDGGETWTEQKTWNPEELSSSGRQWTLIGVDLSEAVAGKVFRARLRMHGPGTSYYYMKFDNISICEEPTLDAPAGLINTIGSDGRSINMAWQDVSHAYKLNYINECPLYRFTIGNGGNEVIGANKFEPADLKLFDGKYLTGVSTKINHYDDVPDVKGIHASVVVYEEGKLVHEQEIEDFPYNEDFTVVLDKALPIDAGKELMIGIKVFDYDAEQTPLAYVQSLDYLPGKSDLYSEDGGRTWQLVSDFYATQEEPAMGYCCWDITGCITDGPELILSGKDEPYAYIVYRNGEPYSKLAVSGKSARFTDTDPVDNARYEVVAYDYEGAYSEPSEEMTVGTGTSIRNYVIDGVQVEMQPDGSGLTVSGSYDSASLYGVNGVCVATSVGGQMNLGGLAPGIYMLKIEKDGQTTVQKIMIGK